MIAEFMMLLIPLMTSHNLILHTPLQRENVGFLFRVSSVGKTNFYPRQIANLIITKEGTDLSLIKYINDIIYHIPRDERVVYI